MHTFSASASDDEVKQAVVEWSELLAQKRFDAALAMFLPEDTSFTAADLQNWIANYGSPDPYPGGKTYELTSLRALPEFEAIVRDRIEVNRQDLFGLNPAQYVGMVHYDSVPLDHQPSDLTARFHIKKIGADRITLEFLDIHVM